jgi:serine/threonine-protein kinase
LGKVIGGGGMGVVYEGRHVSINRKVAIKVLSPQGTMDSDAVARFCREAQTAGALGSDNICEVLDLGSSPEGVPYYVMPLLKGADFSALIEGGKLSVARIVDVVQQVLAALEVTHGAGIIHRDIKPANVFVTRVGDRSDFVKVLDFGIAKAAQTNILGLEAHTQTGMVLGTPDYMSPEQAMGDHDIGHLTDIYAVGVMLYEALTGVRPFKGDSYNAIVRDILTAAPPPPCALAPAIPSALESIVLKAMSRLPQDRFPSARDMRAALLALPLVEEHPPLAQAKRDWATHRSTIPPAPLPECPLSLEATDTRTARPGDASARRSKRYRFIAFGLASLALVATIGVAAVWVGSMGSSHLSSSPAASPMSNSSGRAVETGAHRPTFFSNLPELSFKKRLALPVPRKPMASEQVSASVQTTELSAPSSSAERRLPEKKRLHGPPLRRDGQGPKRGVRVEGGPTQSGSPMAGKLGAVIDPNYD